jgi:hypothetical protein
MNGVCVTEKSKRQRVVVCRRGPSGEQMTTADDRGETKKPNVGKQERRQAALRVRLQRGRMVL